MYIDAKRIHLNETLVGDKASNDALKAFEELRKAAQANGTADMMLEEINAEIDAVRRM